MVLSSYRTSTSSICFRTSIARGELRGHLNPLYLNPVCPWNRHLEEDDLGWIVTTVLTNRIPERVVHAKGSGAHGTWECTDGLEDICCADMFRKGVKCPITVRFSTVGGESGSHDLARWVAFSPSCHKHIQRRGYGMGGTLTRQ